jgi:hypothetical protein
MSLVAKLPEMEFRKYTYYSNNSAFNPKYDVVFLYDKPIQNENGSYLSRIWKKNGKHRYYITNEYEIHTCRGCGKEGCHSAYCRGGLDYYYYYKSNYVGRDIELALNKLNTC